MRSDSFTPYRKIFRVLLGTFLLFIGPFLYKTPGQVGSDIFNATAKVERRRPVSAMHAYAEIAENIATRSDHTYTGNSQL